MTSETGTGATRPSGPLTAEAAWRLLQGLRPGSDEYRDSGSGTRLRILDSGGWTTDPAADPEAATLLDLLLPLRRRSAFVVGQLGQSVDGRIATRSGHSHYINGPEDIKRLHRLRALADAVVVGAATVEADDPRLTVRKVPGPNPVRVVLDPSGRSSRERNVFRDGAAPTLWVRSPAPESDIDLPGVDTIRLPVAPGGGFEPLDVVSMLADRGLPRVLVEGGGVTVSRFLAAGALDRLHLSVAPLILGSGRPGIQLPPIETLDEAMRPPARHFHLGTDLLFDFDLAGSGA